MTDQPVEPTLDDLTDDELLELEQLALEETKLAAEAQAIAERRATIKGRLARAPFPHGSTRLGSVTVLRKAGRRTINPTRFAAAFPPAVWPDLYETKPRAKAAVEEHIASAALAAAGVLDEASATIEVR